MILIPEEAFSLTVTWASPPGATLPGETETVTFAGLAGCVLFGAADITPGATRDAQIAKTAKSRVNLYMVGILRAGAGCRNRGLADNSSVASPGASQYTSVEFWP